MSDDLVKRMDILWYFLEEEGYYKKANTVSLAKNRIEELEAELLETQDRSNAFATKEYHTEIRAEQAEAKLAMAVDVIDWALICWDDHKEHGYMMQGDWVSDARAILAKLKG